MENSLKESRINLPRTLKNYGSIIPRDKENLGVHGNPTSNHRLTHTNTIA